MRSHYGAPRFSSFLSTYHLLFIFFPRFLHLIHACNETCGSLPIPYPFSISSRCGLPSFRNYTSCSQDGTTLLQLNSQNYEVLNFADGSVVIDPLVYGNCNEHSTSSFSLTNYSHFEVSSLNTVFGLSRCNKGRPPSSCENCTRNLPISDHLEKCVDISKLYCCSSTQYNSTWFQSLLKSGNCSSFTSWIESNQTIRNQTELSTQYGLKLDFGLPGRCPGNCSSNALCSDSRLGYYCTCAPGFTGDGYQSGSGCNSTNKPMGSPENSPLPCSNSAGSNLPACIDSGRCIGRLCSVGSKMVGLGMPLGVASVAFVAVIGYFCHKSCHDWNARQQERIRLDGISEAAMEFPYSVLAAATNFFTTVVGEGAFGVVYKGVLLNGDTVAVKVLDANSRHTDRQFLNEVGTIGKIHHINVVRLFGFCFEKSNRILVYEYIGNGSLEKYLFSSDQNAVVLDWNQRYNIVLGIARGLSYMHEECRHRIIHCDIKPQNILLDHHFCPRISDFGLARLMAREESRVLTQAGGTPGYMAPEFWTGGSVHLTAKFDVYSFGMVLLEIIGGRKNFKLHATSSQNYFPAWAFNQAVHEDFSVIVDKRIAGEIDLEQVRTAALVALWCIQEEPSMRPSMSQVVRYLEGSTAVPSIPPRPLYFNSV